MWCRPIHAAHLPLRSWSLLCRLLAIADSLVRLRGWALHHQRSEIDSPAGLPMRRVSSLCCGKDSHSSSFARSINLEAVGPRKTAVSASLAVWMASSMPLHADNSFAFDTGKSLLGSCDGADLTKQALCLGKISGYADMLQALKMICLDNNVNRRQTVVVVLKFLSDHPEDIDETAPSRALAALTKAFPCSADASKK